MLRSTTTIIQIKKHSESPTPSAGGLDIRATSRAMALVLAGDYNEYAIIFCIARLNCQ
jgi:hypothetical protein